MATDSAPLKDLKEAWAAILRTTDLSKVETRYGGSEPWIDTARPKQSFCEVTVAQAVERSAGVGPQAFEDVTLAAEVWMPFTYADRSEDAWDALLDSIRNESRKYPTLACQIGGIRGTGYPQLRLNRVAPYSDVKSTKLCHYARLELVVTRHFTFTPLSAIP